MKLFEKSTVSISILALIGAYLVYKLLGNVPLHAHEQNAVTISHTLMSGQTAPNPKTEAILASRIPFYRVDALHRLVQPAFIHRKDLAFFDEENKALLEDMVLMDKVVVIPKIIRPLKQKKDRKEGPTQAQSYTVQLLAGPSFQAVQAFIEKHQLRQNTRILEVQKNGKTWYVLTLGTYPSKQAAQAAANKLPHPIAALKLWIRPIRTVQYIG